MGAVSTPLSGFKSPAALRHDARPSRHVDANECSPSPSDEVGTVPAPDSMAADAGGLADEPGDAAAAAPGVGMQHPILMAHAGGALATVAAWEARSEHDIGVLIRLYLAERPCPGPSPIQDDLEDWAARLEADGEARLAAQGAARLASA